MNGKHSDAMRAFFWLISCLLLSSCGILLLPQLPLAQFSFAQAHDKTPAHPTLRWTEGQSGSTFVVRPDGSLVYTLQEENLALEMTVDSQEMEKVHHRALAVLAVHLSARYHGTGSIQFQPEGISLEFIEHYKIRASALDLDDLAARLQRDADSLTDQTEHRVRHHPGEKAQEEALLQQRLKDITDLLGFVTLRGLRSTILDSGHPETAGWLFFDTRSKWIGRWRPQEDLILTVPFAGRTFEFPFSLPPHKGQLLLRHRD